MPSLAQPPVSKLTAIPVDQYDVSGRLVKSYDSVTQAAKANGLTPFQILRALRPIAENGRYSTGGFFWRKKGTELGDAQLIPNRGAKRCQVRLSKEGQEPILFPSQSHAARFLEVPPAFICQAVKRRGQCKEYQVSRVA